MADGWRLSPDGIREKFQNYIQGGTYFQSCVENWRGRPWEAGTLDLEPSPRDIDTVSVCMVGNNGEREHGAAKSSQMKCVCVCVSEL